MKKIDLTMTATLRPSLLEKTLNSICNRVVRGQKDRYRLIVNIDRIGEDVNPKFIVKICKKFFDNTIFNISITPSFPKAVKWVWSRATSEYVFHIEDDWEMTRDIDVDDMIRILDNYSSLSSLRLSKYDIPRKDRIYLFSGWWNYIEKDGFYLAENWERQFGLNPILIKRKFINQALFHMVDNVNPEKQFRSSQIYMVDLIKKWKYGLYSKPGEEKAVIDIGFDWKQKNNFKKQEKVFLTWEKI